jgi:hypothetical protein
MMGNKLFNKFFQNVNSPPDKSDENVFNLTALYNFIYNDNISDTISDDSIFISFQAKNKLQSSLSEIIRKNDLILLANSIQDNPDRLLKFNSNNSNFITRIYRLLPLYRYARLDNSVWITYTNLVLDRDIGNFPHEESNHDMNNEMFFNTCPICNNGNIQCLNDNKGHHQALCSSNTIARKNMHGQQRLD